MAYSTRFAKPNMANLPAELGRAIIEQILNTPKPDDDALEKEANLFEKKILRVREKENGQRAVTKRFVLLWSSWDF